MAKAAEIHGLHAAMTYAQAAAMTVAVRGEEVFEHSAGVLDTGDIERVHAMRVATRRLRAVMEVYSPCFERDELRPVLREVKALADALGARRDPDVELLALEQFAASVGPDERSGIELFIDRTRGEQRDGNRLLAVALAEAERTDLRGRIAALAANAERDRQPDEPEPDPEAADPWAADPQTGTPARPVPALPADEFTPRPPQTSLESDHVRPVNGGWS